VLQNSLKSPLLHSQILCIFLGIFPQIFLPPKSFYSISNPILIQKSIKIDFSFYSFGFQPEQQFRPGLLPPFLAQLRPTSSLPFRPSRQSSTSRPSRHRPSGRLLPLCAPPSIPLPHSDGAGLNHRPVTFPLPH
jgi:hypothetical protein